nr:MAG TPA: hypothetical protein [Caudoviricetes sp.]
MRLNKILKRFYKNFNIKPIQLDYPDNMPETHPEITDEMYIELLLLNVKFWRDDYVLKNINKTALKYEILSDCCYMVDGLIKSPEKNKIIKKVQRIFKGGLNERP